MINIFVTITGGDNKYLDRDMHGYVCMV